jgi:hypothetical protein
VSTGKSLSRIRNRQRTKLFPSLPAASFAKCAVVLIAMVMQPDILLYALGILPLIFQISTNLDSGSD